MVEPAELQHVAREVRRRRLEQGWTLDTAAARLGISRRLLVQIEAGDANPSLSSLLSIATGFGVPLVELLADAEAPAITVQHNNRNAALLWQGPAGGEGRLLVASGGLELWDWTLQPSEEHRSDGHRKTAREALTVTSGALTIATAGAEPVTVKRGQSAAFAADTDHSYRNSTRSPTRYVLAVYETS